MKVIDSGASTDTNKRFMQLQRERTSLVEQSKMTRVSAAVQEFADMVVRKQLPGVVTEWQRYLEAWKDPKVRPVLQKRRNAMDKRARLTNLDEQERPELAKELDNEIMSLNELLSECIIDALLVEQIAAVRSLGRLVAEVSDECYVRRRLKQLRIGRTISITVARLYKERSQEGHHA